MLGVYLCIEVIEFKPVPIHLYLTQEIEYLRLSFLQLPNCHLPQSIHDLTSKPVAIRHKRKPLSDLFQSYDSDKTVVM